MKNILVIGANGKVGRKLLKHLPDGRRNVIAMIRSDHQAAEISELGAKPLIFDLESDFSKAFREIDCVIFTAGSGSSTGPDKTIAVDQVGAIRAIDFARESGVKLFIMVSAQGARSPQMESPIQHYYQAKSVADKYLMQSGLSYTIYRPGRLTDGEGVGKVKLGEHFEGKGTTNREDLARTISRGIGRANTHNRVIEIFDGGQEIERALSEFR